MTQSLGKILIIEDDRFVRKAYEAKLTLAGFTVITAIDGGEAIELTKTEKPDLILLDLMLPVVSGFEYLRVIKENPETKDIPIVIISNLGQDEDVKRGMDMGAETYFVKAKVKIEEMVERIKELVAKRA